MIIFLFLDFTFVSDNFNLSNKIFNLEDVLDLSRWDNSVKLSLNAR